MIDFLIANLSVAPKLIPAIVVSVVMSGCGVNIGAEGFPLETMEPDAPSGWSTTAITGGDDWAEYTYQVGVDNMSVVVCAASGEDGIVHCQSWDSPSETLVGLDRFPESGSELNVTLVCDGPNPCDNESLQGLVADWNAPG